MWHYALKKWWLLLILVLFFVADYCSLLWSSCLWWSNFMPKLTISVKNSTSPPRVQVFLLVLRTTWSNAGWSAVILWYHPTQKRFLVGGERVTCHWSTLHDALGRTKLHNFPGKQKLELSTRRTWSGHALLQPQHTCLPIASSCSHGCKTVSNKNWRRNWVASTRYTLQVY